MTIWKSGSLKVRTSPCPLLLLKAMPMVHHTQTPIPMPRNSRADMRTGSSRAASGTICLKKLRRPLPKLSSMSTVDFSSASYHLTDTFERSGTSPSHDPSEIYHNKGEPYGSPNPRNDTRSPPLPRRHSRRGPRRPAPAHRRDALAREGDRPRSFAGRAAGNDAETRALLGHRLRLPEVRGEAECPTAVHDRDRRPRHPLHPRPVASRQRVAAHHHARLARLGHRDAQGRRPAHRPDDTRRQRRGRFPSGDSVDPRLRVFRQTDHSRLGPCAHRTCLGSADEAPWIRAICGARRRLGSDYHGCNGCTDTSGVARHSLQHAWCRSTRHFEGSKTCICRPAAIRSLSRRKTCVRGAEPGLYEGH